MLRSPGAVKALSAADREWATSVCAQDPVLNVFPAARIAESGLSDPRAMVYGYRRGSSEALCWTSANVVPVGGGKRAIDALAQKVVKRRRHASSVFGSVEQVQMLWDILAPSWGPAREVREEQPVMTIRQPPSQAGIRRDPRVRVAGEREVDVVTPAAEAMFTEEIGYPPYRGSGTAYRNGVAALLQRGHTLVRIEDGTVIFKADLGSVALGVAQVQGVWIHPQYRGRGLAVPAMASVLDYAMTQIAPIVTLYVNDFNTAALATYERVGMRRTGTFMTVLL
ncbi:MAG: GNAT family N-acetyltransferase [Ornithinimicrobium sp.]